LGRVRCLQPAIVRDLTLRKRICHKCTSRPSELGSYRLQRLRCMAGFIRGSATPSPLRTTAVGSRDGQKSLLCRQRPRIRCSNLRMRTGFGLRLHSCQHGPPLLGNLPATVAPFDQALSEDFELGHACCQLGGAFRPLPSAGGTDGHVALEVLQACKAVGITHQYFQDSHLEVHCQPTQVRGPAHQPIRCRLPLCPICMQASCRAEHGYRSARVGWRT
jgi:hypothetical protein